MPRYWRAAAVHVNALQEKAGRAPDSGRKLMYTLEMIHFVRGLREGMLESEWEADHGYKIGITQRHCRYIR